MNIKTSFSIKDLENLSGVKAHTIRIWEKRYELLIPERSDTNIRTYDLESLQKLLNISLLNSQGLKVSKIASLSEDEIYSKVKEFSINGNSGQHFIDTFKMAMLNFDQELFDITYNKMLTVSSFREIFQGTFIQLLDEIGVLWITHTITPAHEHFIVTLIQQKLQLNIERIQGGNSKSKGTYVLFLPENEIHDLGLMYIHFELLLKGYKCIYLGSSVPMANLLELKKVFNDITFVSYFTVSPTVDAVGQYLAEIATQVLTKEGEFLHVMGRSTKGLSKEAIPEGIKVYDKIEELLQNI